MNNNMQATAAQRQLQRTWRSWTRSAISCAKKRQAKCERGVAVTMMDGLMAKLRRQFSLRPVGRRIPQ